jgi:hypothetical protein
VRGNGHHSPTSHPHLTPLPPLSLPPLPLLPLLSRVQQDSTFIPGRQIELGAEFIHGDINPIVELCESQGWARRHIFTWSHGDGGPAEEAAPDGGIGYYYLAKENKLLRFDDEDPDMKRCNEALWNLQNVPRDAAEADTRTLRQYLIDEGVPDRMLGLADAGYGNTAGGTADTVPASRAMRYERAWHGDGSELDPDFRVEPSFGVLISHLAKPLDIEVNSPVKSVHVDTDLLNAQRAAAAAAADAVAAAANLASSPTAAAAASSPTAAASSPLAPAFSDPVTGGFPTLPAPALPAEPPCTVTTVDGRVYRAHRVLITVPLPILKAGEIAFQPPLPQAKVDAVQSMSIANGVKIVLKFGRRPWPRNCHGVVCADSLIPEMWMNSSKGVGGLIEGQCCRYASASVDGGADSEGGDAAGGSGNPAAVEGSTVVGGSGNSSVVGAGAGGAHSASPSPSEAAAPEDEPGTLYMVTGFIMGVRADAMLAENSHELIISRMLAQVDAMFGMDATGAYIDGFVHSWADEPYIRGAYSTPTTREQKDAAARLAEPHLGAVFFAGEATAGAVDGVVRDHPAHRTHFASPIVLHGAMQTGAIAACDIARSFGLAITCNDDGGQAQFVPSYKTEDGGVAHADYAGHSSGCRAPGLNLLHDIPAKVEAGVGGRACVPCSAVKRGVATVVRGGGQQQQQDPLPLKGAAAVVVQPGTSW